MRQQRPLPNTAPTYVINRSNSNINSSYTIWDFNPENTQPFTQYAAQQETILSGDKYHLCAVGGYLMAYSKLSNDEYKIDYCVFKFKPDDENPLDCKPHQKGYWKPGKFISYDNHLTWGEKNSNILQLVPMTGYVLAYMPTSARSTYCLWNFDPALNVPKPPKPVKPKKKDADITIGPDPLSNSITTKDAFAVIGEDSQLFPIGNYVLEWVPAATSSTYRVWSFDPQAMTPLALPTIFEGSLPEINKHHQLHVLGDYLLSFDASDRSYHLWLFDPHEKTNALVPVQTGTLPSSFDVNGVITAVQTDASICKDQSKIPGTMDFMRDKIKHVVVYMVESRSMDSVLGWLYENSKEKINFINGENKFDGTSTSYYNKADKKVGAKTVTETFNVYKYREGVLGHNYDLNAPAKDPYHGTPDSIHQQYSDGYSAYFKGKLPDMGGFVKNNCSGDVMVTLTPKQLPVLNGLAKKFAVSDQWFSALPGGTDSNRGIALTGSAFNITTTLEGNPQYEYFADMPHRQSLWKVLWNNGVKDWKIYWSVKWLDKVFSYQLYLKGDIPSVDNNVNDGKTDFIAPIEQFKIDAKHNQLPKFSFLEPVWIAPSGATSYHPGGDLVPAEKALNEIYEAVTNGPGWEQTALIVTFSKGGGLYDHVPPPKTINPWPNDINDGFSYDVLGPRVPAIIVSPWVNKHTVFRAAGETPLSATSLPATLLKWFGIPKSRWGMGDRIPESETFEFVFERKTPRKDKPQFSLPYDQSHPRLESSRWKKDANSGEWNTLSNWTDGKVPTDKASFSNSVETDIKFKKDSFSIINKIEFSSNAASYNFLIGPSKIEKPALTIAGEGVSNLSSNKQYFTVAATTSGPWNPQLNFTQSSNAGGSNIHYTAGPVSKKGSGGGVIKFSDESKAGSASFTAWTGTEWPEGWQTVGGEISFYDSASADIATFKTYGTLGTDGDTFGNVVFHKFATAFKANFTNAGGTVAHGDGGNTQLYDNTTAAYGVFKNLGGTHYKANGGDTAFDGNATGGFGCFYNYASETEGAYGGVTSFNNNPPNMNGVGASAGNGSYHNYGSRSSSTGGGHLRFSALHGAPTAANATIINYGSYVKGQNSAGNTSFSMLPPTNYFSSAGSCTIHNQPAEIKGGAAGYTEFKISTGYGKTKPKISTVIKDGFIPTADHATIYNIGAEGQGVAGGYTLFSGTTTAGDARIFAHGGSNKGKGGAVTFSNTSRAGSARLIAEAGSGGGQGGQIIFNDKSEGENAQLQIYGNATLDMSHHIGKLTVSTLELSEGNIIVQLGGKTTSLNVLVEFTLLSKKTKFKFVKATDKFKFNTEYTVFTSSNLSMYKEDQFKGNKIEGITPTFRIAGKHLKVEYKK